MAKQVKKKAYLIESPIGDDAKARLGAFGLIPMDEVATGDYELHLLWHTLLQRHMLGIQRVGMDMSDPVQQLSKYPNKVGSVDYSLMQEAIKKWIDSYGTLCVGSENPKKVPIYLKLLNKLGFSTETETLFGIYPIINVSN